MGVAAGTIQFPAKAACLFQPAPYKVFHGGRGSSKTWDFCRALIILGVQKKLFILCAREIQKSIKESVHRVLWQQIDALNLNARYDIQDNKINGKNGTELVFAGIRNNITAIKSMEAIDICAVFEATFVSEYSWDTLEPTVRRDPPHGPFGMGSEIWVEFNPDYEKDFTYLKWVIDPPPGTIVVEMNFKDNPWFPEILRRQMEEMRKKDYDKYLNIWEGKVRRVLSGAIYAKEIEAALTEGRISPKILVDRQKPVDLGVDLGRSDMTSIWFFQQIGMEHNAVDYYGNFGYAWEHYLKHIQERRYIIRRIYLPHDAHSEHLAATKSIERQTRDVYPGEEQVIIVPRTPNVTNDINAVRSLFPRMQFNEKTCADGLTALSHYRYEVDPETKEVSLKPLHDWASHPADALRTYVMGLRSDAVPKAQQKHMPRTVPGYQGTRVGWMGS